MIHDVRSDGTRGERLTCYSCDGQPCIVRQPWMTTDQWNEETRVFSEKHTSTNTGQWYLVMIHINEMAGHFEPLEEELRAALLSTNEADARAEAWETWTHRTVYTRGGVIYPRAPRLVYERILTP